MSIRLKLLLGFIIPSVMLLMAGMWSSSQMRSLGKRVQIMLAENERSVQYMVRMNDAIERLDSAVLLRLQGDEQTYQAIYQAAAKELLKALGEEQKNLTLPGEKEMVDTLAQRIEAYLAVLDSSSSLASGNLEFYRLSIAPLFKEVQGRIGGARQLNHEAMYKASSLVAASAKRAALPADLIIFSAIVFALLFGWLTQIFIVSPIRQTLEAVKEWHLRGRFNPPRLESGDELREINKLLIMIAQKSGESSE